MERERPLSGPIRRCRREETYGQATEAPARVTVTEHRTDGRLARHWQRQTNGESTQTYEYGPTGLLLRVRFDDGVGPHSLLYVYELDDRLARVIIQNSEGREHVFETYEYNADGRKTRTQHLDSALIPPGTPLAWAAPEGGDGIAAVRLVDGDGRLLMRVDYLYDDSGNVIEEALTRTDDMLPQELVAQASPAQLAAFRALLGVDQPARVRHRYDASGRRVESSGSLDGPGSDERKTMAYNDHGDLIASVSEKTGPSEGSIDEQGRIVPSPGEPTTTRSETRAQYEYDARGNWTEMVVQVRSGENQEFSVRQIQRRVIEYYDDATSSGDLATTP